MTPRLVLLPGDLLGRVTGRAPDHGLACVERWGGGGWHAFGVERCERLRTEGVERHHDYSAAMAAAPAARQWEAKRAGATLADLDAWSATARAHLRPDDKPGADSHTLAVCPACEAPTVLDRERVAGWDRWTCRACKATCGTMGLISFVPLASVMAENAAAAGDAPAPIV